MNLERLQTAVREAQRFLDRAGDIATEPVVNGGIGSAAAKKSGALRRASMDLTRALADLRRSN